MEIGTLKYRPEIDGLRAVAVLFVLAYHAFPSQFPGGFIGVDIFFVISGYLITKIIGKEISSNTFSLVNFYQSRIKRIFPALLLVMIVSFLYGWFRLLPDEFIALSKNIASASVFISNLFLWSNSGYFDRTVELNPLVHLWSLGVEEQFYIFWPLLLTFIFYHSKINWILVLLGLLSFSLGIYQINHDVVGAFYSPLPRFWEFLFGAFVALQKKDLSKSREDNLLSIAGLVLIFLGAILIDGEKLFPGFWALLPAFGSCLLIYAPSGGWVGKKILSTRIFVFIGLISYPLYLWHWVILSFIRIQNPNPIWYVRFFAIIASFILAFLTYRFIERPIRSSLNKYIASILFFCMMIVLGVSVCVFKLGLFIKEPSSLQKQLMRPYSVEEDYRYKKCFLDPKTQQSSNFSPECMALVDRFNPSILIWGDSLAAQLYTGLKNMLLTFPIQYNLLQLTAGSCPPGLEIDHVSNGSCDEINAYVRRFIEEEHPEIVVINGRWENGTREYQAHIRDVVAFLKKSKVKQIVLVGPSPDWAPELKKMLMWSGYDQENLPDRMQPPKQFWSVVSKRNSELLELSGELGIDYISPMENFCDKGFCLIRVSNNIPSGLITYDHDHLTTEASEYFFDQLNVSQIFKKD